MSTANDGTAVMFATLLDALPPGRVLNVGAGLTGSVGDARHHVINVDHVAPSIGPHELRTAKDRFVVADASSLPFAPRSFDGVIAKDVLEHVADPVAVLAELARVCTSNGRLVAVVPRAIPRAVWDDPTHVRGFTERAVSTALRLSGWEQTHVGRIGGFPGAGRLRLTPYLGTIMRVPLLGHWFGRNWLIRAVRSSGADE